jgi:DNA-binding GntR family transcriptional regulator
MNAKVSLSQQAYDKLEEMLVSLELKPGHIYSEKELTNIMGFGRTPLREALQKMSNIDLVEIIPRMGIKISEIILYRQLAILEARRPLDELIAKCAARRATDEQKEELITMAIEMEKATKDGNVKEYLRLDHMFDELLDEASRNIFLTRALDPLHIHCRRFWAQYQRYDDLNKTAVLHEKLMRAVANGDESKSGKTANDLVNYLVEFTRKALDIT